MVTQRACLKQCLIPESGRYQRLPLKCHYVDATRVSLWSSDGAVPQPEMREGKLVKCVSCQPQLLAHKTQGVQLHLGTTGQLPRAQNGHAVVKTDVGVKDRGWELLFGRQMSPSGCG